MNIKTMDENLDAWFRDMNDEVRSQKLKVGYFLNAVNQFVENGYEVSTAKLVVKGVWREKFRKQAFRINFKKEYSKRPYVFFTVKELGSLAIKSENDKKTDFIYISAELSKLMTSYFEVEVSFGSNNPILSQEMADPVIEIQYAVFNQGS